MVSLAMRRGALMPDDPSTRDNGRVRWVSQPEPGREDKPFTPPHSTIWDLMLESGRYKPIESNHPDGPWVDCTCLDNGDVVMTKRYSRLVRKEGWE